MLLHSMSITLRLFLSDSKRVFLQLSVFSHVIGSSKKNFAPNTLNPNRYNSLHLSTASAPWLPSLVS